LEFWHRFRRFVASLRSSPPSLEQLAWAETKCSAAEWLLFERFDSIDQRHSIAVAEAVELTLDQQGGGGLTLEEQTTVVRAALLHDIGKTAAGLHTSSRVLATVSGWLVPTRLAQAWRNRTDLLGRFASYWVYPEIGAQLLREAGSDPWVVSWAAQHHDDPATWDVPQWIGNLLAAADR
jgi:hypothetical protein